MAKFFLNEYRRRVTLAIGPTGCPIFTIGPEELVGPIGCCGDCGESGTDSGSGTGGGGGTGTSNHKVLTHLEWTDSAHYGTPDQLAAFDAFGNASYVDPNSFDPAGAASIAVAAHEAAPDPHPQYVETADTGGGGYAFTGSGPPAGGLGSPGSTYLDISDPDNPKLYYKT